MGRGDEGMGRENDGTRGGGGGGLWCVVWVIGAVGWGVVCGVGDRGVRRLVVVCGVPPPT